jgi:hypothetical protein
MERETGLGEGSARAVKQRCVALCSRVWRKAYITPYMWAVGMGDGIAISSFS